MERSLEGPQLEAHIFQRYYKSIKVLQLCKPFFLNVSGAFTLIKFLYLVEQNSQNSLWLAFVYHTVLLNFFFTLEALNLIVKVKIKSKLSPLMIASGGIVIT